MKRLLKILKVPMVLLSHILYYISFICRRKREIWVFGSNYNQFNDNAKYFFRYISRFHQEISAVWITGDRHLVRQLKKQGFKACYRWSLDGILYTLRAKYFIFNSYVSDINYSLSGGAILINLWHGIPLKKIEFDIKKGKLASIYNSQNPLLTWIFKIVYPKSFTRPDFVVSTSPKVSECFASAFRIPKIKCLETGYPRNDIFFFSKDALREYIQKYEDSSMAELLGKMASYKKIFVYMPTFRDTDDDFIARSGINFERLDEVLAQNEYMLIMKLHPNTSGAVNLDKFSNIIIFNNRLDIYPILPFTDVLITDYSSVYFDYVLLDKEIVFFPFDFSKYIKEDRELYYNYLDVTPGEVVYCFNDLIHILKNIESIDNKSKRALIREMFWGNYDGGASESLFKLINDMN